MPLAAQITKTIRSTSATRNHELSAVLKAIDDVSTQANRALNTGVNSSQKGVLHGNLSRVQNLLGGISANGDADVYFQEIAFEELDMLIGRIKGATSYKALNTIEYLSSTEKHILEKVFNILIAANQDNASQIIDTILEGFAK